jgi:flagellar assembly protein FliH
VPLTRGRVLAPSDAIAAARAVASAREPSNASRVVPREVVLAHDEARAIVARARTEAEAIVARASADALGAREAAILEGREVGAAALAAAWMRLRSDEARALAAREQEILAIARALAERLIGRALSIDPDLVLSLAREALSAVARARRVTLFVHPDDAEPLRRQIAALGLEQASIEVSVDPTRSRGNLRAETDLGTVDSDVGLRLDRLVAALAAAHGG